MNRNRKTKNIKVNEAINNMSFTNSIDNFKTGDNKDIRDNNRKKSDNFSG